MMAYAALGLGAMGLLYLLMRGFVTSSPRDLAYALKTFAAVFAVLASTGLLFTGRFGLALVTLAATVMAIRALVHGARGADPMRGSAARGGASGVETDLLSMRLDHASGEVGGRVKRGAFAGRELSSLGLDDLLRLLAEATRDDPQSTQLMQAYLDRRFPDWQAEAATPPEPSAGAMDDRTALEILGLAPGAGEAEIKSTHRRLMARLHPDHGGSPYLTAQLNRARDQLLRRRG